MKVPTVEALHGDLLMRQMGKAVFIRKNAGWNFASSFWAGIDNHLAHGRPQENAFRTIRIRAARHVVKVCRADRTVIRLTNVKKVGSASPLLVAASSFFKNHPAKREASEKSISHTTALRWMELCIKAAHPR
jgi:hypothetical protein